MVPWPRSSGETFLLPCFVGLAGAAEQIFTGAPIAASEAERIGPINRLVPSSELEKSAQELALKPARGPVLATGLAKQALKKTSGEI
jgi:2-(1,2-epoxy-1,2-dihydrophenyl)acetyl-CoA isomerase